jgi:hypothetical protein
MLGVSEEEESRWQMMLGIERCVREIRAEQLEQVARLESHEERIRDVERVSSQVATREDTEVLRLAIEDFRVEVLERRNTDLSDDVCRAESLGKIRERVGRLEGAQIKSGQRNTAHGAIGGSAAVLIIWVVVSALAQMFGLEVPSPPIK